MNCRRFTARLVGALGFFVAFAWLAVATATVNGPIRMSDENPTRGEMTAVSLGGGAGVETLTITYFPASEVSITTEHAVPFGGAFNWTPVHAGLVSLEYTDLSGETTGASVVNVRYGGLPVGALVILVVALVSLMGSFAFAVSRMRED